MINQKESSHPKIRNYYLRWKNKFDNISNGILKKLKNDIEAIIIIPNEITFNNDIEKKKIYNLITLLIITKDIDNFEGIQKQIAKREKIILDSIKLEKIKIKYSIFHLAELWNRFSDYSELWSFSMSNGYPIYSERIIDSLILSIKLKESVYERFNRYVLALCFSGSVARLTFTKNSDFDIFLVIDDTDVKNMSQDELRGKIRTISLGKIDELSQKLKIPSNLNLQTYLLTEFWYSLKNNSPVIHTLLRDGIPLFDKGIFVAWKKMLQRGVLTPTSTACEIYVQASERNFSNLKKSITNFVIEDLYWVLFPIAQSILMLNGIPPTTPKETLLALSNDNGKFNFNFNKETIPHLNELFQIRKDYEHGKIKEISLKDLQKQYEKTIKSKDDLENVFQNQKKRIAKLLLDSELIKAYESINSIKKTFIQRLGIIDNTLETEIERFLLNYEFEENSLTTIFNHFAEKKKSKEVPSLDYYERLITYVKNKLIKIEFFVQDILNDEAINLHKTKNEYILIVPSKKIKINISKAIINDY